MKFSHSVLRSEAMSGSIRFIGQISMVVMIGICAFAPIDFEPGWADPLNFTLTASSFLIPIGAGSAALRSIQLVKSGVLQISYTSARGPGPALRLGASAVCLWQVTALLMGMTLAVLRADLRGPFTLSMILLPVLALTLICVAALAGAAVGRVWQNVVTAPVVVAAIFAFIYFTPSVGGNFTKFAVIYPSTFYQAFFEPNTQLILGQVVCAVGLAALALTGLSHSRRYVTAALAGLLVLAGAGTALRASASPVQYTSQPSSPACESAGTTQLCAWPYFSAAVPKTLSAIVAARQAVDIYAKTPSMYAQEGLRTPGKAVTVYLAGKEVSEAEAVNSALQAVLPPLCGNGGTANQSADLAAFVAVKMGLNADFIPDSVVAAQKLSLPEQRLWFTKRLSAVRACHA